jgi:hypothetical protein
MSYQNIPGAEQYPNYPQYSPYQQYGPQAQYGAAPGPAVPGYGSYQPQPPAYRGWITAAGLAGVLFSMLIGMPIALVALRNSRRVRSLWSAGDQQGAYKASRSARTWAIAATVFDILGLIFVIALLSRAGHPTS